MIAVTHEIDVANLDELDWRQVLVSIARTPDPFPAVANPLVLRVKRAIEFAETPLAPNDLIERNRLEAESSLATHVEACLDILEAQQLAGPPPKPAKQGVATRLPPRAVEILVNLVID